MIDQIDIELVLTELIRQMYKHHQIESESKIKKYLEWKIGKTPITFGEAELQEMKTVSEYYIKQYLETDTKSPDKELRELKRIVFTKIDEDLSFLLTLCSS